MCAWTLAASKARLSEAWPYAVACDWIIAPPDNFKLLFENEEMRLIEVMLRPGDTSPMQGTPYPSILMMDSISDAEPTVKISDPKSPLNGQSARTFTLPFGGSSSEISPTNDGSVRSLFDGD